MAVGADYDSSGGVYAAGAVYIMFLAGRLVYYLLSVYLTFVLWLIRSKHFKHNS